MVIQISAPPLPVALNQLVPVPQRFGPFRHARTRRRGGIVLGQLERFIERLPLSVRRNGTEPALILGADLVAKLLQRRGQLRFGRRIGLHPRIDVDQRAAERPPSRRVSARLSDGRPEIVERRGSASTNSSAKIAQALPFPTPLFPRSIPGERRPRFWRGP